MQHPVCVHLLDQGEQRREADRRFRELGLAPREEFSDGNSAWTWEPRQGFDNGTLLIGHLDVPLPAEVGAVETDHLCQSIFVKRLPKCRQARDLAFVLVRGEAAKFGDIGIVVSNRVIAAQAM